MPHSPPFCQYRLASHKCSGHALQRSRTSHALQVQYEDGDEDPRIKFLTYELVVDEDNVSFAYTITGTQDGPFNGIPATGKKIKVRGMQISKFNSDAKIIERWGASHEVGILQQIGALKPVAHLDEPPVLSVPASAGKI